MHSDHPGTAVLCPENSILNQAMRGDPSAFCVIYETYKSYVFSLCVRMTHNPTLAEDLTQDVFFRVWKKISSYQGNSRFRTWLHRVAVNTVLMHFRQRKCRIDTVTLEESILPLVESRSAVSSKQLDDQISIRSTFRRLSPGHRQILLLHEVQGYRHEDISSLLGISSGASKSQLHKARLRLRAALEAPHWSRRKKINTMRAPIRLRYDGASLEAAEKAV
jgi:RNA polymerase sigma-70 factor (ECF subfamily)